MDRYLISVVFCKDAVRIAKELNLKRNEWVHIPYVVNENERYRKLAGQRVKEDKYLIGSFSDKEKEYLLPKAI